MQNGNNYITMLGTGNALATRCYNTCFTLHGKEGVLLVDAGGGNGILAQLEKAGIRREDISDLFVTHAHTDHLLGCIWMMRMALQFRYPLRVWSHKKVLGLLTDICRQILPLKEAEGIGSLVTMNCLNDGEQLTVRGWRIRHAMFRHPSTVLDAARLADELNVKNLILYHTEDHTLDTRRQRYTTEAKTAFSGRVLVPDDLERIVL